MKKGVLTALLLLFLTQLALPLAAQESAKDSVETKAKAHRPSLGGYGEITYSRNFYSDSPYKYSRAASHKNDPGHGRFDLPHAVIYLGYDFGKGWSFNTEIEFEHGGCGGAIEKEAEEGGEWELETEKGGEVELEQFWIQKSFGKAFNIRAGHIIVPFGMMNAHHEPLNFFTVFRSEGENTILPSTWHQTGLSLWGRVKDWKYEAQFTGGLDAMMFDRLNWIHYGATSPYEFDVANRFGLLARADNYMVKGLRLGLSAYYGQSMHNTFPNDNTKYRDVKGHVLLGAFDFAYNAHNWIARGGVTYGSVSDAETINILKASQKTSPYRKAGFGKNAVAASVEAGYDFLSLFANTPKIKDQSPKLYLFGHYEFYNSHIDGINKYTQKQIFAAGLNYMPMPQICVKAEYKYRAFQKQFNDEPAINLGICYQGFFL